MEAQCPPQSPVWVHSVWVQHARMSMCVYVRVQVYIYYAVCQHR